MKGKLMNKVVKASKNNTYNENIENSMLAEKK